MVDFQGDIVRPGIIDRGHIIVINYVTFLTCLDAADVLSGENFGNVLSIYRTSNYLSLTTCPALTLRIASSISSPQKGNRSILRPWQRGGILTRERP